MAIKPIIILLVGLALASVRFADAQQANENPADRLRVGNWRSRPILGRMSKHCGKGYEISVILKGKTS